MSTLADVERTLDADPLAARLARIAVPPLSDALRLRVVSASADHASAPRSHQHRRRSVVVAMAAVAAGVSLLALTPAGHAVARALLPEGMQQRLGLVEGAPRDLLPPGGPGTSVVTARPGVSPMPCSQVPRSPAPGVGNYQCFPDLSLAEVQRQVGFAIPTPSNLTAGLTYRGGMVESPHSVYISYGGQGGGLGLTVRDDAPVGGSAVPAGSAQPVTVAGGNGWFVRGSYEDKGPGTTAHWNPDADTLELTWQRDGLTFDLTAGSLHLSREQLIAIAESVR